MARLDRRIGIRSAEVRLPPPQSAGPALIKTAQGIAEREFEKAADIKNQEAQQAAAKLNFERDGDGNLLAPSLPLTKDGLLAPSIYDRAYTDMVGQRYLSQMKIDTHERLNLIATKHRFDPDAYREVAESYVAKVTELAPDRLKPDVNNTAQIRMVEHYNLLIREKAERDHAEAADVHSMAIGDDYDDLAGYTISGADDEIIGGKMMQIRARIMEGTALNFWNEAEAAARVQLMDQKFALSAITRDLNNLADDEVAYANAKHQLTEFATGEGTIRMVDETGNVANVPVEEVYPNPEDRAAIADAGIGIINQKETARGGYKNARDGKQSDDFYKWYLPHSLDAAATAQPISMAGLEGWFNKAEAQGNVPLMQRIQSLMLDQYNISASGSNGTRAQRHATVVIAEATIRRENAKQAFLKRHGYESENQLSYEQRAELETALRNTGDMGIQQGAEMAETIGGLYAVMNAKDPLNPMAMPNIADHGVPLEVIEKYIDNGMGQVGVIGWDVSVPLNRMLSSSNEDDLNRGLDIARMMYKHNKVKANFDDSTALGSNGKALAYIFENYSPSGIQGSLVREILHKFSDPNYHPHLEWKDKTDDERSKIMASVEDYLDGRYTSTIMPTSGYEVPELNFDPFRPALGSIPVEMEMAIFGEIRNRAGFINSEKPENFERHIEAAINSVVKEQGWVPSKLGWSESRFTSVKERNFLPDSEKADYAYSQFAPEAFYRDADGNPMKNVLAELESDFNTWLKAMNKEDPSLPKLVAGENAFLEYNAGQSTRVRNADGSWRTVPAYNVRLLNKDSRGELATSNKYVYGDQFAINFELAYQTGAKKDMETWKKRSAEASRRRDIQQQRIQTGEGVDIP